MPFTVQDRVEAYVGSVTDTGALSDWLIAGARRLIDLLPRQKLLRFLKPTTVNPGQELSILNEHVVYVTAAGIEARPVQNPAEYVKYTTTGSLYFAPATDPRYMFSDGKLKILPVTVKGEVHSIPYPSEPFFHRNSIPYFPPEAEELVVQYGAVQFLLTKIRTTLTSLGALTVTLPSAPAVPAAFSDTITSSFVLPTPAPTAPTFSGTITTAFTAPTLTLTDQFGNTSGIQHVLDSEQDLELTSGKLGEIDRKIAEHQANLAAEIGESNDKIGIYKSTVDAFQAQLAKYSQEINLFQAQIQGESAESADAIGVYRANLDAYQGRIGAYGAQVGAYQSAVRAVLEEYAAKVTAYAQQYQGYALLVQTFSKQYYEGLQLIMRGATPVDNKTGS